MVRKVGLAEDEGGVLIGFKFSLLPFEHLFSPPLAVATNHIRDLRKTMKEQATPIVNKSLRLARDAPCKVYPL